MTSLHVVTVIRKKKKDLSVVQKQAGHTPPQPQIPTRETSLQWQKLSYLSPEVSTPQPQPRTELIPIVSLLLNNPGKMELKDKTHNMLTALYKAQQHLYNLCINVCGIGAKGNDSVAKSTCFTNLSVNLRKPHKKTWNLSIRERKQTDLGPLAAKLA